MYRLPFLFSFLLFSFSVTLAQHKISIERVSVEREGFIFEKLDSLNLRITYNGSIVVSPHYKVFTDSNSRLKKLIYKELFRDQPAPSYIPDFNFKAYTGTYQTYHANGQTKLRCNFKHNRLDGKAVYYDKYARIIFWESYGSGRLYASMEYYPNSYIPKELKTQKFKKQWYSNGIMSSEELSREYIYREWYNNGTRKHDYDHHNKVYRRWHPNGMRSYQHLEGVSTYWDSAGSLIEYFEPGVKRKIWENGKLIQDYTYDTLGLYYYAEYHDSTGLISMKELRSQFDSSGLGQQSVNYHFVNGKFSYKDTIYVEVFEEEEETFEIFEIFEVERKAAFPGGVYALNKFFDEQHRIKRKSKGVYHIQFIIDKNGSVTQAWPIGDNHLNPTAQNLVRILTSGPKWLPAEWRDEKSTDGYVMTVVIE